MKRVYLPPAEIMRLIEARQAQGQPAGQYQVQEQPPPATSAPAVAQQARLPGSEAAHQVYPINPLFLDRELMGDCIQFVLEWIESSGRSVSPAKVRKAIMLVYDGMLERENKDPNVTAKFARQVMELIAE